MCAAAQLQFDQDQDEAYPTFLLKTVPAVLGVPCGISRVAQ